MTRSCRSGSSGRTGISGSMRDRIESSSDSTKSTDDNDTRPNNSGNGSTPFRNAPWGPDVIFSNNRPKIPKPDSTTKLADNTLTSIAKRLFTPN